MTHILFTLIMIKYGDILISPPISLLNINRVKTTSEGKLHSLPINLHTINQYFDKNLSLIEAKSFIKTLAVSSINSAITFQQQSLKFSSQLLL
jgi:UDP-galactopyranose mutase